MSTEPAPGAPRPPGAATTQDAVPIEAAGYPFAMGHPRSGLHTAAAVLLFVGAGFFLLSAMIDLAILLESIRDGHAIKAGLPVWTAVLGLGGVLGIVGGVHRHRGRGRGIPLLAAAIQFGSFLLIAVPGSVGEGVGVGVAPLGWLCGLGALVLLLIPDRPEDLLVRPAIVPVAIVQPPRLNG